jgi:hypothetical protein
MTLSSRKSLRQPGLGLSADAVLIDHNTALPALITERTSRLGAQEIA